MPVPAFQEVMRPMLALVHARGQMTLREVLAALAEEFALSDADTSEPIPSGRHTKWESRVYWAKTHLYKAGALDSPRRGVIAPNERTAEFLLEHPHQISLAILRTYSEYQVWRSGFAGGTDEVESPGEPNVLGAQSPSERLDSAAEELRAGVIAELEAQIQSLSPTAFERLVIQVVLALDYGARGSGEHLGRSGDGGVDGVIREDRLGLDRVYLQAKRYTGSKVGTDEIRGFVGSLVGHKAQKGVFITSSDFTDNAKTFAANIQHQIALIGGRELAALMYESDVGVSTERTVDVKALDTDFFEESLA